MVNPTFFETPGAFRDWLQQHHGSSRELLVGFYKKNAGQPSLTWAESVDEALCFGWIDGVRTGVDQLTYTIRFTPREVGSVWSLVNVRRARTLIAGGRMAPAGLRAFEARVANTAGDYSYEQRPDELIEPYASMLARHAPAHRFFTHQTPSYRRAAIWWVISAKKEETRVKRAESLIELSALGQKIPQTLPGAKAAAED